MRQTVEDNQLNRMLTVRQVADFLQVSICSVRRWSDNGSSAQQDADSETGSGFPAGQHMQCASLER
jgi:hypothetical protein